MLSPTDRCTFIGNRPLPGRVISRVKEMLEFLDGHQPAITEDLMQQSGTDNLAAVNRHYRGSAIGVTKKTMAAANSDDVEASF
jgi:hypothetical protein